MSSTSGGPPLQDEAAKVLSPKGEPEEPVKGEVVRESAANSRSVQLSRSELSTDSGSDEKTLPHANGLESEHSEALASVASNGPQQAEEDRAIGNRPTTQDSEALATSQAAEHNQSDNRVDVTSQEKNSIAQESEREQGNASEDVGDAVGGSRPIYVTSQASIDDSSSPSSETTSKINEDITQSPPIHVPTRRRVKFYALSAKTGAWDDRGTGCVDIRGWDSEPELCVISELDPSVLLLESPILADTTYHVQQESLIVWNEPREGSRDGVDLAISFQENQGCAEIWERITDIQQRSGRNGRSHRNGGSGLGSLDGGVDDLFCKSDDEDDDYPPAAVRLPPAKPKHVQEILTSVAQHFLVAKKRLITAVLRQNYVEALCDLFKICEDLNDTVNLYTLFDIFRTLVMLHHPRILDRLFANENVFQVMGALEYDPELVKRPQHRHFLENVVVFNQVVPLPQHILDQIHRSFRIQYMKDVVLPRILDETTFTFLNSMIMYANSKIAMDIKRDENILKDLFEKMKAPETTPEQLKDYLRFLNELCEISKHLEAEQKSSFYAALHDHGLLEVLQRTLVYPEMSMLSVEILLASIDTDGRQLRKYLLKNRGDEGLLSILITRLHEDEDTGVKNVITDLLRFLVDIETGDDATDRVEFLNMFYHLHLDRLLSPILNHPAEAESKPLRDAPSVLTRNLIDLVGFLLMHHGTRARNHIITYKILSRMNPLIGYVDKHVALAALRNLRLVLGLKDAVLNKVILKENLIDRVVKLFLANANKYNLINSACLELFVQLKKDGHPAMISHFVQQYYDQLSHITYTDLFTQFKLAADENKYQSEGGGPNAAAGIGSGGLSLLDDEPDTPPLAYSYEYSGASDSGISASPIASRENDRFQRQMEELDYFESGDDESPSNLGNMDDTTANYANKSDLSADSAEVADASNLIKISSPKRRSIAPEVPIPSSISQDSLQESISSPTEHTTSNKISTSSSSTPSDAPSAPFSPTSSSSTSSRSLVHSYSHPEDSSESSKDGGPGNAVQLASKSSPVVATYPSENPQSDTNVLNTTSTTIPQAVEAPSTPPGAHSSSSDTVHKKRKSPSLESSDQDDTSEILPLSKRPKAEEAVDAKS